MSGCSRRPSVELTKDDALLLERLLHVGVGSFGLSNCASTTPARNLRSCSGMPRRSNVSFTSSGTSSQLRVGCWPCRQVVADHVLKNRCSPRSLDTPNAWAWACHVKDLETRDCRNSRIQSASPLGLRDNIVECVLSVRPYPCIEFVGLLRIGKVTDAAGRY